ncbi:hypothetical protein U91I_02757 [alpha proteobacterium U9-1i]|nr:hypothetical protein U91I_02757 [alpha proteobacterium U9-1i]
MQNTTRNDTASRELWPVSDFCAAHGVSKTTVYELIVAGKLTAVKIGRRSLITEESRRAWRETLPRLNAPTEPAQHA